MGIAIIGVVSSSMALPWDQRNRFVSSLSSSCHSNFVTFRPLSFSTNTLFSKGCLSMSTLQRPTRYSVVCMSKKYAPNTATRKKLSRKRGGNLDKKRKGRRKAGKRKVFKIVKLVSTAGTGFFYAKKRSRKIADKLQLWKYDPCVKRQVQFKEEK